MIQKTFSYVSYILRPFSVLLLFILFLMPPDVMALSSEKIAVLPFKIYMLKPMEHLVLGLQEMLTTRLAKEGFDLIDPATINKGELSRIKVSDLDFARRMGKEKGIDWVIKGSLTQIGKKISLDLTIIPISPGKRPFSIFVVGDRIDKLDQAMDRVAVTATNRIKGVIQIDSIAVKGNKRIETDAILAVIESRKGEKYDQDTLNKDLRSIYQMGFFEDVQIDTEDCPGGKSVTFKVSEKPSIGKITLLGTKKIDQKDLMDVLGIKKYSIIDMKAIKDSIERLKDHYHQKGYYHVEIKESLKDLPNNEVALIYNIKEGDKAYIREIIFEGNVAFDDDDLKDLMETTEKGFFSFLTESGNLDKKKLEGDVFKIKSFYQNNGYIKARVGEPDISYKKDEGLIITITINEGPQYAIGKVMLEGDLIKDMHELYQSLKITKEKVYNREVIRSDTLSLSEIYSDEGYAFVDVSPDIKEDDKEHKVDITYKIFKGKKVRFKRIAITGNDRTRDKVIRRELKVIEGGYFSGEKLKRSTQNLYRLGFFEEVKVNTKKGNSDEEMILDIHVKERPTGMFSFGIGYSSAEHTIGTLHVSQNNLFGRGQSLAAKASLSNKAARYTLSFIEPWLFDKPLLAGIDLYNWEYEYDEYTKDSTGGRLKFGFPLGLDFTRGSAIYTYDDAEIRDVLETSSQIIKDMIGRSVTSSLTLGVSRDSRDRRFNARKGSVNSFTVEYAGGFLGGDNYFTKYRARSAWFFPFFWDTAFSMQGKWGYIDQRPGGELPVYEKFRLGGMNTVRGFRYGTISPIDPATGDRIGGEKMMVYNLEFRFPLQKEQGVMGVLFFDAGNVFTKDEDYTFSGIRRGAGAGIRWYSPMGPLRLEWGKNLDPKPGEAESTWEFTIGTPF
ncbi:MAG: outer membrane protein assembly factor BamA [Deltaproteobacteria bacterium]|nr:outer membrane protein assembly factor BamA [Deltaproteobacteria bacterium]MBW2105220.1 outer membrane protein assembly factor BamA [Deltaproteobacteria bacterium]MBW2332865.1 outer membrane protein assembly factor BamA [Deltaproteobacteria bacterium]RLB18724.1 MAG: outer membrane protein assembly factor BamA [Deltaproteobacteria bacterium]RLB21277.1 MAG: outer membrane protein assembly factor BamA [Deltaproteobacteria bacterium]